MAIRVLDIEPVLGSLRRKVEIPPYQRPYKWDERLVLQLLQDLQHHQDKPAYRLGTLVFHQEAEGAPWQVVDGQQRLITLALLAYTLGCGNEFPILKHQVSHGPTQATLSANAALIARHLRLLSEPERQRLRAFVETQCEWVVLVLDDLSEAFQFFDSQNSRGKELEPYDLLKAYHLRAMEMSTEDDRRACVEAWEKHVEAGDLKEVVDDYLYRIRRWLQGKSGREFRKHDVDLFKGVRLDQEQDFPYLLGLRIHDRFTRQYGQDPVRAVGHQMVDYPFQIGQVMLDGQRFFEYVLHYIELRSRLIRELPDFDRDLFKVLDGYEGRRRDGDLYTRNLFDCVVLCYVDKFGTQGLKAFLPQAFAWTYALRLTQRSVRLATMDNKALSPRNLFDAIRSALRPGDVLRFRGEQIRTSHVVATKTGAIQGHLKMLGVLVDG